MVILEYKDEMHDLFWLGNKFRGGICMNCYKTIRERTAYVREHCLFSSDVSGFSAQWETEEKDTGEEFTFLKADRNSLKSDDFRILLCVYDHRGIEWSISPLGMRRMKRQLPRRGWFHRHEYVEILYVIEGSFDQFLLGERYHFPQGCFVITDQNCEHSDYIDAVDAAVLFLQIKADYLDELLRSYPETDELHRFLLYALCQQKREQSFLALTYAPMGETGTEREDLQVLQLLEQITQEDLGRLPGYEHVRLGLLIRLLRRLCTDYSSVRYSSSREGREQAFLYELERYIRLHDAEVSISELEHVFHYRRNYFNLILQKYRGQTFRKYIQTVRLDHAVQLLKETALPIKQIAIAVGYENTSHFYHLFEEKFGMPPKDMREKGNISIENRIGSGETGHSLPGKGGILCRR